MGRKRRRSAGKIDRLPEHIRDTVDQMLLNGFYYREIIAYLRDQGETVSQMSVSRYASKFLASMEQIQVAQENFRLISEEIEKYPNLDTTEVILRIASQQVLNALTGAPAEMWEDAEPDKLLKNATALIRAASYKRKTDRQGKTDQEAALEANKTLLFEVLSRKHPELYRQVMDALKQENELLIETKQED